MQSKNDQSLFGFLITKPALQRVPINGGHIFLADVLIYNLPIEIMGRKRTSTQAQRILKSKTLNRERARARRQNETVEERSLRLEKLRMVQQERIELESKQERERRLARAKNYQQNRRTQESGFDRQERLEKLKEYQRRRLENETPEARQARLLKLREAYYKRREMSPPTEKRKTRKRKVGKIKLIVKQDTSKAKQQSTKRKGKESEAA